MTLSSVDKRRLGKAIPFWSHNDTRDDPDEQKFKYEKFSGMKVEERK
jgi:hypothetical protein